VPQALTTARAGLLALPCPCPDPAALPFRPGRWLFGGIGFHHFGHALIFSTARLWALDHLASPPDGILFFDRGTEGATRPGTTRNLTAILEVLGIDLPVITLGTDEQVEQLIVPEAGISTSEALFCGTEAYRRFLRARLHALPRQDGPADVYISRRNLGLHQPGLMFEDRIEAHLVAAGYHVVHPQRAPLARQIATYRAARRIIGVDGSALHVVAMAARPGTKVAILGRRPFYPAALAGQVRAIGGAESVVLDHRLAAHAQAGPAHTAYPWLAAYALPDLPALSAGLARAGFLAGQPHWPQPADEEVEDRLALIARRTGSTLVPLPSQ
jgi:capsular polysaccharide biosynthesis protein